MSNSTEYKKLYAAEEKKCSYLKVVITVVVVFALLLFLVLIIIRGQHKKPTSSFLDNLISREAIFPNGSFTVNFDSLKSNGKPSMAPLYLTHSMFSELEININIDNSSLVAESGRLSYFYIWLPVPPHTYQADLPYSYKQNKSAMEIYHSIEYIGIRFGGAATVNVIPLSLVLKDKKTGLNIVRIMPDLSAIYQLEIRMPDSMCNNDTGDTCRITEWQPYTILNDESTSEPGSFKIPLPVACGSQCKFPSDSPCAASCRDSPCAGTCHKACEVRQNDVASAPITRRFKLGSHKANVYFTYDMNNYKHQMRVVYQNKILYDTGCIWGYFEALKPISYSGNLDELRVDIEPSCDQVVRGFGWHFTVSCPCTCGDAEPGKTNYNTSCISAVILKSGDDRVNSGDTVYITANGLIPPLVAYHCGPDKSVKWHLQITPFVGKDEYICCQRNYTEYGKVWNIEDTIRRGIIQGGKAKLSWTDGNQNIESIHFNILGTQPSSSDVKNLIVKSSKLWYLQYIAIQESGLKQFDQNGYPLLISRKTSSDKDVGYGIFQITTPRLNCTHYEYEYQYEYRPACGQLWNWNDNVAEGIRRLERFNVSAYEWMAKQREYARNDNQGKDAPVLDHINSNCIFRENTTMVIEDAIAIKLYNSYNTSQQQYCEWQNKMSNVKGKWIFNNHNDYDYVNLVCQKVLK